MNWLSCAHPGCQRASVPLWKSWRNWIQSSLIYKQQRWSIRLASDGAEWMMHAWWTCCHTCIHENCFATCMLVCDWLLLIAYVTGQGRQRYPGETLHRHHQEWHHHEQLDSSCKVQTSMKTCRPSLVWNPLCTEDVQTTSHWRGESCKESCAKGTEEKKSEIRRKFTGIQVHGMVLVSKYTCIQGNLFKQHCQVI